MKPPAPELAALLRSGSCRVLGMPPPSEVLGDSGLMAQPVLAVRTTVGLGVEQGRSGWGILPQPGGLSESDLRAEPRVCELRETQNRKQAEGAGDGLGHSLAIGCEFPA